MVQPLWKTVWRFLKKLKIGLPYDPAVALLGIYPRDTGVLMHRGTCTPMFIAALLSNAGHEESCANLPGPSGKAKYSRETDSERVL